jgi:M6 family metalloprotease-like protein
MRFSLKITAPALLSVAAIFFSAIPSTSANPPKSGALCSKAGLTKNYQGKKYTCVKSGKKLVWNKGTSLKKQEPSPTASPSITPTPTSTPSTASTPTATSTPTPSTSASPEPKLGQLCAIENERVRNAIGELFCRVGHEGTLKWALADEIHRQSCSNENERIRNSINEFRCLRWVDGTLRWQEVFRYRNPNPRQSLSAVNYQVNQYFEPKIPSLAIQNCKIKENSDQGAARGADLASGFPFMPRFDSYPKKFKMALIPIDFIDLEGDKDFRPRVDDQIQLMSDWYKDISGGRLSIEWVVSNNWIRLPGSSKDYFVEYSGKYPDTEEFWKKVLPVVDSKFDLTGVQTINFILPSNQKIIYESVQSFSFLAEMKKYNSTKTTLYSFSLAGEVFEAPEANQWSYWAHEFGHELGLAHIGSSRGAEVEPLNGLDLMGNQNGPYRELSGWMRFIIGWLDDSQVYCQDTTKLGTNEISLVPLNENKNGLKMVVIPTGPESAIIIESRRPTKYACNIPNLPGGVLVYTYDAKLGNQSYFLKAHYPADRKPVIRCEVGNTLPDVLLKTGDSVKVGNYEISVTSLGTFDQIKIVKN